MYGIEAVHMRDPKILQLLRDGWEPFGVENECVWFKRKLNDNETVENKEAD